MDIVVIIIVILGLAVMVFKRFSNFVYYIGIVDIFLRIFDYIANNINISFISNIINSYLPNSVFNIVDIYSSGIFTVVLNWILVIIYMCLDVYLIRTFFRKK